MAALGTGMGVGVAGSGGRMPCRTRATGRNGGGGGEKGPLDWLVGLLQKEEQLLETDPILMKVEDKSRGTVSIPANRNADNGKKKPFGGLFAKN